MSSTGLVSCCSSIFGMFHVYPSSLRRLSFPISFFSLFLQFTSLEIESFSRLTSFRSSPFQTPARAFLWSFTGVRLFRFQSFELAAGFDLAPFRKNARKKNVVHSSPRPRCLGIFKESNSVQLLSEKSIYSVSELLTAFCVRYLF